MAPQSSFTLNYRASVRSNLLQTHVIAKARSSTAKRLPATPLQMMWLSYETTANNKHERYTVTYFVVVGRYERTEAHIVKDVGEKEHHERRKNTEPITPKVSHLGVRLTHK